MELSPKSQQQQRKLYQRYRWNLLIAIVNSEGSATDDNLLHYKHPKVQLQVLKAKILGIDGLFYFIRICKFGCFKNPFATITSLPELYFRIRRFILFAQTKKVIFMNYGSSTSSWKLWRWVRLDLMLSIRDIYINSNLNPLTNSLAAEAPSSKISSHGTSLKWSGWPSQSAWE